MDTQISTHADEHAIALKALGAKVTTNHDLVTATLNGVVVSFWISDKYGVSGTYTKDDGETGMVMSFGQIRDLLGLRHCRVSPSRVIIKVLREFGLVHQGRMTHEFYVEGTYRYGERQSTEVEFYNAEGRAKVLDNWGAICRVLEMTPYTFYIHSYGADQRYFALTNRRPAGL
jgi:hypothetical protein